MKVHTVHWVFDLVLTGSTPSAALSNLSFLVGEVKRLCSLKTPRFFNDRLNRGFLVVGVTASSCFRESSTAIVRALSSLPATARSQIQTSYIGTAVKVVGSGMVPAGRFRGSGKS